MTAPRVTQEHFKFSTAILRRLGEELNPHPDQSIVELIRNSYDADALNCRIKLQKVHKKGGTIHIKDDGNGMSLDAIINGWLLLGRSEKTHRRRTTLGRRPVGDKGLGRLAALRMGRRATLLTRPKDEPLFEHKLVIDWARYDNARVVEDVVLDIETGAPSEPGRFGTEVVIENLTVSFTKKEVQRLARSLLLLADPFDNPTRFRTVLDAPEFRDLEEVVNQKYFPECEYHLVAELDAAGRAKASVSDSSGRRLWCATHEVIRRRNDSYKAPPATFEFWAFNLGPDRFLPRSISVGDIRSWLRAVGGVHFYHRGLRVYPYGDPGHDWLDINLRRAQSPELRPSTNNSIGRVSVEDPDERLVQKTDRSGFIEDTPFEELRSFAQDALEWLADCRLKKREEKRIEKRAVARRAVRDWRKAVDKAVSEIPEESQRRVKQAIAEYETAVKHQTVALREEIQLYRTLSTVGTTFAVLAHELKNPLTRIRQMAEAIQQRGQNTLKEKYSELFQHPVDVIAKSANAVVTFPSVASKLLERDKRQAGRLSINAEIRDVLDLFEPFLKGSQIHSTLEPVDTEPSVLASKASLQSVFVNLLTNSMNAFFVSKKQDEPRTVVFRTSTSENRVRVNVLDNGPGIQGLSVKEVWLPGKTTLPNGTGLGLTIVRDTVIDLGGRCYAIANGELGGAEIIIELPLAEDES